MLQYSLISLSVVSTGPDTVAIRALVQVKDSVDTAIISDRLIEADVDVQSLGHANGLLDSVAVAMTNKIPGAPPVQRQQIVP